MTAYYIDNTGIYSSDNTVFKKPDVINGGEWLLNQLLQDKPKENKLLYDLDACVASLIKLTCTEQQSKELYEKERVNVYGGIKLTYFPTRFFAIDGRGGFVNFGNMVRYKSDVHYSPNETEQDKINKAKEADTIAKSASDVLGELGLDKQRIISPVGALIDKYVWSLRPPTVDDIPEDASELAYQTIKGNWLEAYKLGSWEVAYDYDINLAYGSVLANLADTRRGEWLHTTTMPNNALYGFASGSLEVNKPFHPFVMKQDDEYSYTPIGSRKDALPKSMIDLLYKYKLGTFNIEDGWWWIPCENKPQYQPLKGILTHLHKIRSESSGLKKTILRQMIAGIWGRMLEIKKERLGDLFNPVWGSIVENEIKCRVADTCLQHNVQPLLVAIDGIVTDKPLPIESSMDMGKWRLSHKGKCIIVSSGVVGFEGKQGAEEFALHYEWLRDQLQNEPNKSSYAMTKHSPLTLAKAMQNNDFEHLGELQQVNRTINVGKDYKRLWQKSPACGGDLLNNKYESMPIDSVMARGLV
jgi:hypothetical protein